MVQQVVKGGTKGKACIPRMAGNVSRAQNFVESTRLQPASGSESSLCTTYHQTNQPLVGGLLVQGKRKMSWKLAFGQRKPEAPALASLQAAPSRTVWRKRAYEVEDCVLLGHEQPVARQVRLRSFPTNEPASLVFTNSTDVHVRVIWLTFEGEECLYSAVAPGSRVRYLTYADSHVWIVREVNTGRRMQLNGAQAVVASADESLTVEIRDPPSLPFQESTCAAFPAEFQQLVRTVLLCHNRCSGERGSSADSSNSYCSAASTTTEAAVMATHGCGSLWQSAPAAALSSLPKDLLLAILTKAAPYTPQDAAVPLGHPDVLSCQWHDAATFAQLVEGTKVCQENHKGASPASCRLQ